MRIPNRSPLGRPAGLASTVEARSPAAPATRPGAKLRCGGTLRTIHEILYLVRHCTFISLSLCVPSCSALIPILCLALEDSQREGHVPSGEEEERVKKDHLHTDTERRRIGEGMLLDLLFPARVLVPRPCLRPAEHGKK